jgi:hypothetical protein
MISSREQLQQQHLRPKDYNEYMTWRIRWYLTIAITITYILLLVSGLIGYWAIKDTHYLFFIAPTALIPFVRYLVPMDKRRYDLKIAEINAKKEIHEIKAHIFRCLRQS